MEKFLFGMSNMLLVVFALFLSFPTCTVSAEEGRESSPVGRIGTVTGQLMAGGEKPLAGGRAAFFVVAIGPPASQGSLRRIPEVVAPLAQDGKFTARLPAGRYYLGAMSRDASMGPGPPRQDEEVFSVLDAQQERMIIEIAGAGEIDLGQIRVVSQHHSPEPENYFTVTGTVRDDQGRPFAGAYIFVKINPHSQRPNFVSAGTGADGRFEIRLPAGRPYYLVAKETVSTGRPAEGERVGAYLGSAGILSIRPAPVPITGNTGEPLEKIDIVMHRTSVPGPRKDGMPEVNSPPSKDDKDSSSLYRKDS